MMLYSKFNVKVKPATPPTLKVKIKAIYMKKEVHNRYVMEHNRYVMETRANLAVTVLPSLE